MLGSFIQKIHGAWRLSWQQKIWIIVLYPISGIVRASVLVIPFKYLHKSLGIHSRNLQFCTVITESQLQKARQIGNAIIIMSKYTPWESNCMVQAILARWVLSLYGIPYVMYMGAYMTKDRSEPMKAHAWITAGPRIVVGAKGHQRYAIVSTFASKQLKSLIKQ